MGLGFVTDISQQIVQSLLLVPIDGQPYSIYAKENTKFRWQFKIEWNLLQQGSEALCIDFKYVFSFVSVCLNMCGSVCGPFSK